MTDGIGARAVFIAGPTASGKSAAALDVAERTGAEIVNADAIQVYRDLEILSARPSAADERRARHHLFGFLDARERCSAGRWARAAAAVIDEISTRSVPAVVVGGTGLYFRALGEGLSAMPAVPEDVRTRLLKRREEIGAAAFRDEFVARDPRSAKFAPGDQQRIMRAAEVLEATGRSIHEFQSERGDALIAPPIAHIVIEPDRAALYAACEARFERMVAAGALEEARRLAERGLDPSLPAMKALGVAELLAALRGEMSLDEAVARAKMNTRRFAKRQLTWFRGQATDWTRVADWRSAADLAAKTLA